MANERTRWLINASQRTRETLLRHLGKGEAKRLHSDWFFWAREEQVPPASDWRIWLVCAGRGFGKTRTGAEWVNAVARENPAARIALLGASIGEARAVMVEGESGILACSKDKDRPHFEASLRRLTWPKGAQAHLYSAAEPESLRGPQHSHAHWAGAEGIVRQRSIRPCRHLAAPCHRGPGRCATFEPCCGRRLAGGQFSLRRLVRTGW